MMMSDIKLLCIQLSNKALKTVCVISHLHLFLADMILVQFDLPTPI